MRGRERERERDRAKERERNKREREGKREREKERKREWEKRERERVRGRDFSILSFTNYHLVPHTKKNFYPIQKKFSLKNLKFNFIFSNLILLFLTPNKMPFII